MRDALTNVLEDDLNVDCIVGIEKSTKRNRGRQRMGMIVKTLPCPRLDLNTTSSDGFNVTTEDHFGPFVAEDISLL